MVITMPGHKIWVLSLSLSLLPGGFAVAAQSQGTGAPAAEHPTDPRLSGIISGTIVDPTQAAVAGARVRLSWGDQSLYQEVMSDDDGQFSFANVAPGPFQLTITSVGFTTQASAGVLQPGESFSVPQIAMALATAVTEVRVVPTRTEVAEDQIKAEEKQRGLDVVPQFYESYYPNAVPLHPRQ